MPKLPLRAALVLATAIALAVPAAAQTVALTGRMGERALLVIDGAAPQVLAVGEVRQGVTLIAVGDQSAVVSVDGRQQSLHVGESPVSVAGAGGAARGNRVLLHAGSGGHYFGTGQINGMTMRFVVDTGASNVVMGAAQAEQLGINYRSGQPELVSTANGTTAAYRVALNSLRIDDVEVYNVDATIVPVGMPFVLLGNSFLGRFQIRQENDLMVLEKRY